MNEGAQHKLRPFSFGVIASIDVYLYNIRMLDLARAEGFDWDAGNARKSEAKHSVGREEAEQVFYDDSLIVVPDIVHSAAEERFHAFGKTSGGRPLHIAFTLRAQGRLIRVISARDMSAKERARYA